MYIDRQIFSSIKHLSARIDINDSHLYIYVYLGIYAFVFGVYSIFQSDLIDKISD